MARGTAVNPSVDDWLHLQQIYSKIVNCFLSIKKKVAYSLVHNMTLELTYVRRIASRN